MVEVQRHRGEIDPEPVGGAATTPQPGRDLTRRTEPFGQAALEEYARAHDTTKVSVVRMAALYYLADGDSERHAWRVPRFVRRRGAGSAVVEDSLSALDEETLAAIQGEAFRQGVSAADLASHAVLYFLADADSGRLAGRVGETIGEEEGES